MEESVQLILYKSKIMPASEVVSKLISAVRQGRLEEVKDFMNTNDISSFPKLWGGYRLLHLAVVQEKPEVAEFLLRFDCNVNSDAYPISDTSPLHIAAQNFYLEIVKTLLAKCANVEARDKRKRTPLVYAMASSIKRKQPGRQDREYARRQIIELLVSHGADVNSCDCDEKTPLHIAVDKNDIKTVEFLLDNKANPDLQDTLGRTPLYCAVQNDVKCRKRDYDLEKKTRMQMIGLLINRGANINASDLDGKTPVHVAVDKKDTEMVKFLLDKKANPDVRDKLGRTALLYAIHDFKVRDKLVGPPLFRAIRRRVMGPEAKIEKSLIELLLKGGADVNIADAQGLLPLHACMEEFDMYKNEADSFWTVAQLLQHGANINRVCNYPNCEGFTPLHFAAKRSGCAAIVDLLLKNGADVNAVADNHTTPLGLASINSNKDTVETILNHAPNIENENKCRYLNIVVHKTAEDRFSETPRPNHEYDELGKWDTSDEPLRFKYILNHLLEYGITLDNLDNTTELLKAAIVGGSENIVEELLNNGVDVNLLDVAADYDKTEMVDRLLRRGAYVNVQDGKGNSPLFYAVRNSNVIMTKMLLSSGTKVNIEADVLNAAVVLGHREIVDILFAYDPAIDVNAAAKNGETALFCTVRNKNKYFVGFRCKSDDGAEVDAKAEIARLLLSKGADFEVRNIHGRTLLAEAVSSDRVKLIEVLFEHGVEVKQIIDKYSGNMTIHIAAVRQTSKLAEQVLKLDPDILESVNYDGKRALQIAVREDYHNPVKTFLDYGADIENINEKIFGDMIHIFNHHRHKLLALNRRVSKHFLQWLSLYTQDDDYREFQKNCVDECERMKNEMIANTSLSFYDIVVKNVDQLAIWAKNQRIVEGLKSSKLEKKFPIYASFITTNVEKAVRREEWLRLGLNAAVRLFGAEWPVLVLENMLTNLSNTDLRNFVRACS